MVQALRLTGTVAELHARDPFGGAPVEAPAVWWCDFTDAAIVLGSSQRAEILDAAAVASAGLSVVHRRSGGGAVLLRPGSVLWIDLVLPVGSWPNDVRGSMLAAGELWRDALVAVGAASRPRLLVHTGGMVTTAWSAAVCFAGLGPGEVLDVSAAPPRKLVGLSQRRTRGGARIQGLVHIGPLVASTARLVAAGVRPDEPLAEAGQVGLIEGAALADGLAQALVSAAPHSRAARAD